MTTTPFLASWVSAVFCFSLQDWWSLTWVSQSLFWWLGEASIMQQTNKSNPTINYSSAKYTRFCMWCGRALTGEWKCLAKKWQIHWHHRRRPGWKEEVQGEGNEFRENLKTKMSSSGAESSHHSSMGMAQSSVPNSCRLTLVQDNRTTVSLTPLQMEHRRLTC